MAKSRAQLDREVAAALASFKPLSKDTVRIHRQAIRGAAGLSGKRGGRSHATKAAAHGDFFAVEIDRSEFDTKRDLPAGAHWRSDLGHLAEEELARGRSYRRPKDARYAVIEWTGYRAGVGRLLDWLEGAEGVTRYAEIFA